MDPLAHSNSLRFNLDDPSSVDRLENFKLANKKNGIYTLIQYDQKGEKIAKYSLGDIVDVIHKEIADKGRLSPDYGLLLTPKRTTVLRRSWILLENFRSQLDQSLEEGGLNALGYKTRNLFSGEHERIAVKLDEIYAQCLKQMGDSNYIPVLKRTPLPKEPRSQFPEALDSLSAGASISPLEKKDLISEIARHLELTDLVHLQRVSKASFTLTSDSYDMKKRELLIAQVYEILAIANEDEYPLHPQIRQEIETLMAAPFFKNHAQLESAVCARDLLVFNHRVLCAKNESVRIDTFLGKSHQITEIDKLFFDINITAIDSIAELCAIVELMQLQGRDPHPELVTALDFSNCHLTHLPEAMNQYWKEIAGLDLSNNQLQELPKGIGQCQKLLQLSISDNPLQSLPKELFQIESLISVSADADQRSQFPELSFLKQFRNGKRDVM